jgi:hypothetical protein
MIRRAPFALASAERLFPVDSNNAGLWRRRVERSQNVAAGPWMKAADFR